MKKKFILLIIIFAVTFPITTSIVLGSNIENFLDTASSYFTNFLL